VLDVTAGQVWGRDDGLGGLGFRQRDIDKVVQTADHRGPAVVFYPMTAAHGRAILNLCVSVRAKFSPGRHCHSTLPLAVVDGHALGIY
jgi:hypothetical protein